MQLRKFSWVLALALIQTSCLLVHAKASNDSLFPTNVPSSKWVEFNAHGYETPVTGVVYRKTEAIHGMPLGGLGTGYIDLDTDGTLGRCTAFNSFVPPREIGGVPFLGIAIDGQAHLLTTKELDGIKTAQQLHYWGHYPIADLEFDIDAPVGIGLRTWTPFIPGDVNVSNTPGAVFEVHLRNQSASPKKITLVFSFPGPTAWETGEEVNYGGVSTNQQPAKTAKQTRETVKGHFTGITFSSTINRNWLWRGDLVVEYALGIIGGGDLRHGGPLGGDIASWKNIATSLPPVKDGQTGASVAIDVTLDGNQSQVARFVLAWYAPRWMAQQFNGDPLNGDRHVNFDKYGDRFSGAPNVAQYLARGHEALLGRIIAWQQVIYGEADLPGWLSDCLINVNHNLAQNAFWARPVPRGSNPRNWSGEQGVFSINESLVSCPQPSCTPCEWLGNMPILYFFPELAELNLRSYAYWQLANGKIPFNFGYGSVLDSPTCYDAEAVTNGGEFVQMLDRLWQRTGDRTLLEKYYPNAKSAVQFTKRETDVSGNGLPDCEAASHFFDCYHWYGPAVPVSSFWLGSLKVMERMAQQMPDHDFVQQCRDWFTLGEKSLEELLWNEPAGSYLLYNKPGSPHRSDLVAVDQLLGEWVSFYHGVEHPYRHQRVQRILKTLQRLNFQASPYGMVNGINPDGTPTEENAIYNWIHAALSTHYAAALMMYAGDDEIKKTGLEAVRRTWKTFVIDHGRAFNMPIFIRIDPESGKTDLHTAEDYFHNTSLWMIPPALYGQDVKTFCGPGGLVDRIIKAGNSQEQFGHKRVNFDVGFNRAFVIKPEKPAPGHPWLFYHPVLSLIIVDGATPADRHTWLFEQLLENGFHIGGVDAGDTLSSLPAREAFTEFYKVATQKFGLSTKACLFGESRGGLNIYNWAADHPDWVQCIAGIYPSCSLEKESSILRVAQVYGMSPEQLKSQLDLFSPVRRVEPLAKRNIPIFHIHGDADQGVPIEMHTLELAKRYRAAGGKNMEVVIIPGGRHSAVPIYHESPKLRDFLLSQGKRIDL